ncbi:MAG: 2-amino-4-hydroxy-6-hydroxymethyldihydropteridine diphosphokinase [Pseudomonadota bacterium]
MAYTQRPATVYLGLGSNVDAHRNLRSAIEALQAEFGALDLSPVYRSTAVGFSGDDFFNACGRIQTECSPGALKDWLGALENRHGRNRSLPKFADRTLDIDILLYNDWCGQFDGLELPRDEILKYAHVLKPLADLAGSVPHPVSGVSYAEHWAAFTGDRRLTMVALEHP